MSHLIPNPADLHALVDQLAKTLTAARDGDLSAYADARDAARAVEVAARRLDVDLGDEAYRAQCARVHEQERAR